jgi:hypothetical protein
MSRNSKTARKLATAKQFTSARKNGGGGPKKTTPKHGKTKARWQVGQSAANTPKKQDTEE